jgi:hypothetical protein
MPPPPGGIFVSAPISRGFPALPSFDAGDCSDLLARRALWPAFFLQTARNAARPAPLSPAIILWHSSPH